MKEGPEVICVGQTSPLTPSWQKGGFSFLNVASVKNYGRCTGPQTFKRQFQDGQAGLLNSLVRPFKNQDAKRDDFASGKKRFTEGK